MNKILLIGCGHMGSALLKSWYKNKSNKITVVDPKSYRKITNKYGGGVKAFNDITKVRDTSIFNIVIFAIKPQITPSVLKNFKNLNFKKKCIIYKYNSRKKDFFF